MTLETHRVRRVEGRDKPPVPLYLVNDPVEVRRRYKGLRVGKNETERRALAVDIGLMAALHSVTTRYCAIPSALSRGVGKFAEFSDLRESFNATKAQITV